MELLVDVCLRPCVRARVCYRSASLKSVRAPADLGQIRGLTRIKRLRLHQVAHAVVGPDIAKAVPRDTRPAGSRTLFVSCAMSDQRTVPTQSLRLRNISAFESEATIIMVVNCTRAQADTSAVERVMRVHV